MNKVSENEIMARIKINAFSYMHVGWCNRLISVYGSAEDILKSTAKDIAQNGAISIDTAKKFLEETSKIDPEKELSKTQKLGGDILVCEDKRYPESLKEIAEPPMVIYFRGDIENPQIKIAVVGTRKPTFYGKKITSRIAYDLAKCKINVVSGLARGIDSIAHRAATENNATTWAVLGTGLGVCYPAENKKLAETIIDKGGALISEIPFDRGPMAFHFPRRNRIISGLSVAVVVVEGPIRSGSLITAKFALEQGREVLAVPGPIDSHNSEGPNSLIRDGASVVLSSLDIIEHIPLKYSSLVETKNIKYSETESIETDILGKLSIDEKSVFEQVSKDSLSADELSSRLKWSIQKTAGILFELEAKSVLVHNCGKYSRKI